MYDRYASSARRRRRWSADNPGNAAIRAELVDAAFSLVAPDLIAARAILDVGCGSGWWLERLAADPRICARLYGVEALPARASAAQARVLAAAIQTGDARALPLQDASFDVVTMFTVLSSLGSRRAIESALHEARRVLVDGGVLLVWEPRVPNPLNRHTLLVGSDQLHGVFGDGPSTTCTLTVLPALARRLGPSTGWLYPRLARLAPLRTHRLSCVRR